MTPGDTYSAASTPVKVVGEAEAMRGSARNRKRTARATLLRRINAESRKRQAAWLETGQPNVTAFLTSEIEEGYIALRSDRATDREPETWGDVHGDPERTGVEWLPFYGQRSRIADA